MDPMDYSMDDGHQQLHSNPPRCTYQPPQQNGSSSNFPHQPQNAHHYDPVHNTDSWYSHNRPQFAVNPNLSQWGSHVPISSWHGFNDAQNGMLGADAAAFRRQMALSGMPNSNPWAEIAGFEPLPFGYAPTFGNPQVTNSTSMDPSRNPTTADSSSQMPQAAGSGSHYETARRSRNSINIPHTLDVPAPEVSRASRAAREDLRAAQQNQISRSFDYTSPHSAQEPLSHRRLIARPHTWDSDDDDDSSPDAESAGIRRDRLYAELDEDQRTLASMRAGMASGKRVPSKEAIASIEKLDLKDLGEADKSCIICYNDFGVQNPEGLIEHPIRLPKCKHIFGDKCIKKWFEDSDTCPYCRDKLPSERLVPKNYTYEAMQARNRAAALSAAHAAAQTHRARHTFNPRFPTSEELVQESYARAAHEDYHHLMRTTQPHEWSFNPTPPSNRTSHRDPSFTQRDSPERRRQQARGRVTLGRPTSVGSARYYNPPTGSLQSVAHRGNAQILSQNSNTNANIHPASSMPHRPATPPRQISDRQSESSSSTPSTHVSSSEETSPAVAVGSGVDSRDRLSSSSQPRLGAFSDHSWVDHPFGLDEPSRFFPIRRPNEFNRAASFESRAAVSPSNNQHSTGLPY